MSRSPTDGAYERILDARLEAGGGSGGEDRVRPTRNLGFVDDADKFEALQSEVSQAKVRPRFGGIGGPSRHFVLGLAGVAER